MKSVATIASLAWATLLGFVVACGGATPLDIDGPSARPGATTAPTTSERPATNCRTVGPCDVPTAVPPTKTPPPSPTSTTSPPSPSTTGSAPPPDLPPRCQLGLPSSKRFASLTDADIATLCDFLACARGGYGSRDIACAAGMHHVTMPADKDACIVQETAAARAAGSACELTMGMMDACYGAWGENLCQKPSSCAAIDAVAITCR